MASTDEVRRKAQKPAATLRDALDVLEQYWGMDMQKVTTIKQLDSYDDCNFFVEADGKRYLMKCYNGVETDNPLIIEAQTMMMNVLACNGILTSQTVPPLDSDVRVGDVACPILRVVDGSKRPCAVRVCVWVDGKPLVGHATPALLHRSGELLGRVQKTFALERYDHVGLQRYHQWDQKNTGDLTAFTPSVKDEKRRAMVERVIERFREEVLPVQSRLRRGPLQADFNDANIIVGPLNEAGEEPLGLIDFGDIVNSWTVCDIAIGAAYATVSSYGKEHPLIAAALMIHGFVSEFPLEALEIRLLPLLLVCRLTTSAVIGAYSYSKQPDCHYLLLHAEPAWKSLGILTAPENESGIAELFALACDPSSSVHTVEEKALSIEATLIR